MTPDQNHILHELLQMPLNDDVSGRILEMLASEQDRKMNKPRGIPREP